MADPAVTGKYKNCSSGNSLGSQQKPCIKTYSLNRVKVFVFSGYADKVEYRRKRRCSGSS
jgi:hypothetical protein